MTYEEFIRTHPEWHEYDEHCKSCNYINCHHDLMGPPLHLYSDEVCCCIACIYSETSKAFDSGKQDMNIV